MFGQKRKMFSECSVVDGELFEMVELMGRPFGVPFCLSAATAACLRVRTFGDPFIFALVPEAWMRIIAGILERVVKILEQMSWSGGVGC